MENAELTRRVKLLRLAHRLGHSPESVAVAQVLYRLGLAEQSRGSRVSAFNLDRAKAMAEQLESAGQEPLDFTCTILVLGKTGVGKSATVNSIFDENKCTTDAFRLGTTKVRVVVGTVLGITVRVIDTPGLLSSQSGHQQNVKILHSIKRFTKKYPPDVVLYLDRLDMQTPDFGDMSLLNTIKRILGVDIWLNVVVVLTHAASIPSEGYNLFAAQRSHAIKQAIHQIAGDTRSMNPVTLVENRTGQSELPNGQVWKPHLLLHSFAAKILFEENTLQKLSENPVNPLQRLQSLVLPFQFVFSYHGWEIPLGPPSNLILQFNVNKNRSNEVMLRLKSPVPHEIAVLVVPPAPHIWPQLKLLMQKWWLAAVAAAMAVIRRNSSKVVEMGA